MLKAMRKHAKYFYVLFFVVILSFIFWGVGTNDDKSANIPVAEVENEKITSQEYWMAYDRTREFYKQQFREKFNEDMEKQLNLKQQVLYSLIDEKALLIAAKKAGLKITDQELQDAIINDPLFMRAGGFSKDVYLKTLQLNRMSPEAFESMKRRDLLLVKMSRLIGESVDLTDMDLTQFSGDEQTMNAYKQALLRDKRQKAIKSYIEGIKKQMKIRINQQPAS